MTESRDPKTCPGCGTVNPWLNEKCRSCGADLLEVTAAEAPPADLHRASDENEPEEMAPEGFNERPDEVLAAEHGSLAAERPSKMPPQKRWNILWIVIGILLYMAVVRVGEMVILKWIVAPDPELKTAVEEVGAQKPTKPLSEERRGQLKSLLFTNVNFVAATVMLLVISPIVIGCIVGFFSRGVLEGAASMGLAAVLVLFQAGQPAYALFVGPVYAILGLLGALGGRAIYRRIRSEN